ncbi:MAG: hypothetical protein MI919_22030, partial [Holophagales bacterium]|nr:hypothetical protein [Holophagales bacterium]
MSEIDAGARNGETGQISGTGSRWLLFRALLATAACLALPHWVPAGDPFRETLRLLPVVVLGFLVVDHRLRRAGAGGGRRLGLGGVVPWATGALVVSLPGRHALGFEAADGLWAAGLALVLAKAVVERLPGLRRLVVGEPRGAGVPSRGPDPVFFLLPWVVYLAVQPWALAHRQPDGDEPYYLLLAHSLVFDGDVNLADNYARGDARGFLDRPLAPQPGDPEGPGGEVYSRHTAVLPLLLAPAYALAGRSGAAAVMAALAALLAWWTLRLGRRLWPEHGSGLLLGWALLAFAPPLLLYAHQVWVEVPAALCALAALDALTVLSRGSAGGKGRRGGRLSDPRMARAAWVLAASLVLLPALKLRLVLVSAVLLALALWQLRRAGPRAVGLGVGLPVAGGLVLLAYNSWRFGNPARMYGQGELGQYRASLTEYARGAFGVFYDCAFGLFAMAPIWVLLIPALAGLARDRDRRLWLGGSLMLPYLLAVAPRLEWYGGWSPPFRYPLVFLPLLALALVPLLERRPAGTRFLGVVLGSWTALLALLWLVVPGWTYNLADGGSHVLHLASQLLGADVARLFPSMVRYRPATLGWVAASLLAAWVAWIGSRVGSGRWRRFSRR